MDKLLTNEFYKTYLSLLDIKPDDVLKQIKEREWTIENFKFFTTISVMSSSKIAGEELEVDKGFSPGILSPHFKAKALLLSALFFSALKGGAIKW